MVRSVRPEGEDGEAAATADCYLSSSGASAVPLSTPTLPFAHAGYRSWVAPVYGAFEDANPRPLVKPRLTLSLWRGSEAVDPACDGDSEQRV